MPSVTLIRQGVQMTGGLLHVLQCFWEIALYLGVLRSSLLCQDQALKQSIGLSLLLLQNYSG
jgi:hypothetical protein